MRKTIYWKLSLLLTAAGCIVKSSAQALPGWSLIWADEFTQADNTKPDSAKWGNDIGGSGWGNNELQYYTNRTENARIENGRLVIEARKENLESKKYTSARLLTKGKSAWTYGRVEARIKIPRGKGIWPAFWMLGANIDAVDWPNCGEIDIMENIGSAVSRVHGTVHGPGYSGANGIGGSYLLQGAALADDFHVYAIEWEENRIRWFIDGILYFTLTPKNLPNGSPWVFNQPQFLILNVAVGGNWPGSPDDTTVFPQRMTVDYIRVYNADPGPPDPGSPENAFLTVDPAKTWLGYVNVNDLPASGGAFRFGSPWPTRDLRAVFTGPTLTLSPNAIDDPTSYWYIGGGRPGAPGNKIVRANQYVEETGGLAGKSVTFSGRVSANTLTSAHQSVAFIRDFAPDYSTSNSVTAPLVDGVFRITLDTQADPNRHVQYGFETTGVNVWPTDADPFGTVRVTSVTGHPFVDWMAGFDFSAYPNPDLSAAGDPDGDGQNNLAEFALNENPMSPMVAGKLRSRIEEIDGSQVLVLTLPVREAAEFGGSPAMTAVVDGVSYVIEGTSDLTAFNWQVIEIPVRAQGMPAVDDGWAYRSFRLDDTPSSASKGFLRASIATAP